MRICIVTKESSGTRLPTRTIEFAKRFAARGHDVHVFSVLNGPTFMKKEGIKKIISEGLVGAMKKTKGGVIYYEIPRLTAHKDYYDFGLLNIFLYRLFLMQILSRERIQVVITPNPTEGMVAIMGASMGIPFVFDYSEPYFQRSSHPEKTKKEEKKCYDNASLIVSVGTGSTKQIRTMTSSKEIIEITEGYDETIFPQDSVEADVQELKKEMGINPNSKVVMYLGKMWSNIYRVSIIPEILSRISVAEPSTQALVIGEGDYSSRFKADVKSKNIDCIFINEFIPHSEVPRYIALCDVGILPYDGSGAPLKVIEFLAMKKPIVMTHCENLRSLVVDGRNGFMVENSPEQFTEKVLYFFGHRYDPTAVDIDALSWDKLAEKYLGALEKLVN